MKILVSACLLGDNVRWNGSNKESIFLKNWAEENGIELQPVCPEDELYGTPRGTIKLIQIEDKTLVVMGEKNITEELNSKCQEIHERHSDASGFIGIYGSPSCGISVGVKNKGGMTKGIMHSSASIPTTEIGHFKNDNSRKNFLRKAKKEKTDA